MEISTFASYGFSSDSGISGSMIHTSMNVSAVVNCPVRRKWSATVLSKAAADFGEVNKGLHVGSVPENFWR